MMRSAINKSLDAIFVLFVSIAGYAQSPQPSDFAAKAATVTEFDVNGLKVILKRRESAPTMAGGLFLRGGARNIDDKNAGGHGTTWL